MEARLSLKSYNLNLKHKCLKCENIKERNIATREERNNNEDESDDESDEMVELKCLQHCHCSKFEVTDSMMADMSGGQPSRRFKADVKEKKTKLQIEKNLLSERFSNSAGNFKKHMRTELARYRRSLQKNNQNQQSQVVQTQTDAEKKAERLKRKAELEEERTRKRARLDLIF